MKKSNEVAAIFLIPAAIVVGLSIAARLVDNQLAVPLSGIAVTLWNFGVLDLVRIAIAVLFLRHGLTPWLVLLAVLQVFVLWTARYSALGAFFPQTIINGLFLLSLLTLDREQVRSYAAKAFSLIFILAALQKINASYLAGAEFLSSTGFYGFASRVLGNLPNVVSAKILPWLSIAVELIIGVGLLWRPSLFTHVATVFLLLLSIVHPPVLYVYFTAFFYLALIDTRFKPVASPSRFGSYLSNPFLWAIAPSLVVLVQNVTSQNEYAGFIKTWPVILFLILFHCKQTLEVVKRKDDFSAWWSTNNFDLRTEMVPKLALLAIISLFFAFRMGLVPTPIGFSMFSGFDSNRSPYRIEIEGKSVCQKISRRITVFDFSDVSLKSTELGCLLRTPTDSGRRATLRQLCRDYPDLHFNFQSQFEDQLKKTCADQ